MVVFINKQQPKHSYQVTINHTGYYYENGQYNADTDDIFTDFKNLKNLDVDMPIDKFLSDNKIPIGSICKLKIDKLPNPF